jgi:hypothetical protein
LDPAIARVLFKKAKQAGLEGVMSKRAAGLYYSGKRTREWLKFKAYAPRRSRKYFGALVLLPLPALSRDSYTIEEFFNSLIAAQPALRVARVDKSRRGFDFQGCIAEFVRLSVESRPLQSFSLEHQDRSLILAALEQLGLDSHANTSYPLGLKRALGLDRVAA